MAWLVSGLSTVVLYVNCPLSPTPRRGHGLKAGPPVSRNQISSPGPTHLRSGPGSSLVTHITRCSGLPSACISQDMLLPVRESTGRKLPLIRTRSCSGYIDLRWCITIRGSPSHQANVTLSEHWLALPGNMYIFIKLRSPGHIKLAWCVSVLQGSPQLPWHWQATTAQEAATEPGRGHAAGTSSLLGVSLARRVHPSSHGAGEPFFRAAGLDCSV